MQRKSWLRLAGAVAAGAAIAFYVIVFVLPPRRDRLEASGIAAFDDKGWLTIWVPAAVVGDNYWVYLDGHLISAPPHDNQTKSISYSTFNDGNAEVSWDSSGPLLLKIVNGEYNPQSIQMYRARFIDVLTRTDDCREMSPHGLIYDAECIHRYMWQTEKDDQWTLDRNHIFYPVTRRLHSGAFKVDALYFSDRDAQSVSFPFVITPQYVADVEVGQRAEIFIGIPENWSNEETPTAAHHACSLLDGSPILDYIMTESRRYISDPAVRALKAPGVFDVSTPDGNVVLDLPPDQGGTREFNRAQIRDIANQILKNYELPTLAQITDCKNAHPESSQTFDEQYSMVSDFNEKLKFFRALAEN
jgi:hypothetical protein